MTQGKRRYLPRSEYVQLAQAFERINVARPNFSRLDNPERAFAKHHARLHVAPPYLVAILQLPLTMSDVTREAAPKPLQYVIATTAQGIRVGILLLRVRR